MPIAVLASRGAGPTEIGHLVGRAPSKASCELGRNHHGPGHYRPFHVPRQTTLRRWRPKPFAHSRSWTSGPTITNPDHVTRAATLRHQCRGRAKTTGIQTSSTTSSKLRKLCLVPCLVGELSDYDRIIGVSIVKVTVNQHGKALT